MVGLDRGLDVVVFCAWLGSVYTGEPCGHACSLVQLLVLVTGVVNPVYSVSLEVLVEMVLPLVAIAL